MTYVANLDLDLDLDLNLSDHTFRLEFARFCDLTGT